MARARRPARYFWYNCGKEFNKEENWNMKRREHKLIECPGCHTGWKTFIPTAKIKNISIPCCGWDFDTIDFGSFVSPKPYHKMADTNEVITRLQITNPKTKAVGYYHCKLQGRRQPVFWWNQFIWVSMGYRKHFSNAIHILPFTNPLARVEEIQIFASKPVSNW